MTVEPNTPDTGTDNDTPQADDTVTEWDYYDPDDDQDTVEAPEPEATDDGTAEVEEAPETEEEPEEPEEIEAPADAVVTLADGTKMKVDDLVRGHLRQDDYTRKVQDVAVQRKALQAEVERLTGITDAFIDHLSGLIPPAPDAAMALSDPSGFVARKAQHEAAMAQVQELINLGQTPKEIASGLSDHDRKATLAEENRMLAERFPETARKEGRERFFSEIADAAEGLGFTTDELATVSDHRLFTALHYAALGVKAEKAKAAAKAKVVAAPPVAPRRPGTGAQVKNGNAEAMRKLSQSGSLKDALAIDWE